LNNGRAEVDTGIQAVKKFVPNFSYKYITIKEVILNVYLVSDVVLGSVIEQCRLLVSV